MANEKGTFRLEGMRPGIYDIEIAAPGRPLMKRAGVEVRAGLETSLVVTLPTVEAINQTVTVTEPAFLVPEEIKSSSYLIQPREILKAAGALQDVSRYIQTLPGVVVGASDLPQ